MKKIEIKLVKEWSISEIVDLYKAGNWWKSHYNASEIPKILKNSFAFVVAIDTTIQKAIGMGRVISDGISDAYIQDVIVLPEYRRHTIGKQIIKTLIHHCHKHHIEWIGLIAEPGSIEFYLSLDFQQMKNHIPMLLKKRCTQ